MRSTIRSATLIGYVELARSLGLDPYRLMHECGLDTSCLSDPDARISATAVAKLLETSAVQSRAEDFGLRLSKARRLSNLGPFSLVVREETTGRRAIETLGRYVQLHSELLSIRVEDSGPLVILRVHIAQGKRMPHRQGMELFVGYLFHILQELLGPAWKPRRILFTHPAPASLSGHVAVFGHIVDFGAEFNGIVCAAEDLAGQLPTADPVMARYARQYLDAMISRPDMTLADKVRWLVREMLPLGRCSVEKVAQHLGVDRRTVHRHLAQTGETFSSVVDGVRGELVDGYLEGHKGRLADVADLLGFSALSAFSRWHKRHFGFTLTQRRSQS
ncbi:MAG: AraC family transcriptional regulator ligand-binding domain-containing protein [Ramlibacter sp.]|nr:AraC family transcriptional regulator [Ramlibacter sp.]